MNSNFLKQPKAGDIAFSHPAKLGFYSKAVRFLTKSRWSHCFFMPYNYLGYLVVMEADLKVQLVPFETEYVKKEVDCYEIFRPTKATEMDVISASKKCFLDNAGKTYGFLEIPWHALRAIAAWVGIKLENNPIETGEICNELLYAYLFNLGGEYARAISALKSGDSNPEEIYKIVLDRPDLFEFVGKRD
jgi:hypothetical protein